MIRISLFFFFFFSFFNPVLHDPQLKKHPKKQNYLFTKKTGEISAGKSGKYATSKKKGLKTEREKQVIQYGTETRLGRKLERQQSFLFQIFFRHKNKRGDRKAEAIDSPETSDRVDISLHIGRTKPKQVVKNTNSRTNFFPHSSV